MILDSFVGEAKWSSNELAQYIKTDYDGEKVILIKPITYMNLSGKAVSYFVNYYKIEVGNLLVIHDDLDIDLGRYKLKINSSSAGHNGVESIINSIGTNSFLRLKIGISRPIGEVRDYVLDKFSKSDIKVIEDRQETYNYIIKDFIKGEGSKKLMDRYNGLL